MDLGAGFGGIVAVPIYALSVTELLHGAATMLGLHVRSGTPEEPVHRWFEMALPWVEYLDQWTLPFLRDEATRPAIRQVVFNFGTRILAAAAVLILGILIPAKWKQRSRRIAFDQEVETIRARGDPLPNQLPDRWKSTVAPDDNVVAGLAGLTRANGLAKWGTSPNGIRQNRDFRIHPLRKKEFAKIEAWLADSAVELENLRQVLRRKRVQYDYSLAATPDHGLPETYRLDRFVLRLKGVAGLASATGHPDDAADAILEILRLAEVLADHPGWNGQFYRMRFIQIALESLEGVLSAGPIETARLSQLRVGLIAAMNERFLEQVLTWEQFQLAESGFPETQRFHGHSNVPAGHVGPFDADGIRMCVDDPCRVYRLIDRGIPRQKQSDAEESGRTRSRSGFQFENQPI